MLGECLRSAIGVRLWWRLAAGLGWAALLLWAQSAGAQTTANPCQKVYLLFQDSVDAEIAACTRWINSGGQSAATLATAYTNRGWAYFQKGQDDLAIADYDQAIRLDPNDAEKFFDRAFAYEDTRQYEFAIADFDEVIRLSPKYQAAWLERCHSKAILGRAVLALQDCNQALVLRPGDFIGFDYRGLVYLKLARFDLAIIDYNAAIAYDPKIATALYGRSLAERNLGDVVKSGRDRADALKLNPEVEAFYKTLGAIPGLVPDAADGAPASGEITPASLSVEVLKAVEQTPEYRRLLALIEKNQTNGAWLRSERGIEVARLQRQLRSDAQGLDFVPTKGGGALTVAMLRYTIRGGKVTDGNIRVDDLKTDLQYRAAIVDLIAKTICQNGLSGFDWNKVN